MKPPAFQFYPAEFLSDENVVLMNNQEIGCYIKLLCYCWREGSIPNDIPKMAKLCGEDGSAMAQLWLAIQPCFSSAIGDPSRLVHPRLEMERKKQEEFRKERSSTGRNGANKRWRNNLSNNGSAIPEPMAEPMAKHGSSSSSSFSSSTLKKTVGEKASPPTAEEIISQFENDKTYEGINVRIEFGKMAAWCGVKRKHPTKQRFVNWLNRVERPIQGINETNNGTHKPNPRNDGIFKNAPGSIGAAVKAQQSLFTKPDANAS